MLTEIADISKESGCNYRVGELLAKHSTWRVGGPADAFFQPESIEQCVNILNILVSKNIPFFILGNGSNILFGDKGFRGVVVKLTGLKRLSFDGDLVTAESGVKLTFLAVEAASRSLSGLEFAAGIPGTVGGAVRMNAGAAGKAITDVFKEALVWEKGKLFRFSKDDLNFAYRYSTLKETEAVVLNVVFNLIPGNEENIKIQISENLKARKTKQPLEYPNAGSVFKNPPGNYAGKLITEAGLKGLCIGGALVSPKHANFIVNKGEATAKDIKMLIQKVQQEVEIFSGICLETEVEYVGEF